MAKHFISEPLTPAYDAHSESPPAVTQSLTREPTLPPAFRWRDELLVVESTLARRRSSKIDRGDTYLKRHWFDARTDDGRIVTVYYDRAAKRGAPHWWLYSIEEP